MGLYYKNLFLILSMVALLVAVSGCTSNSNDTTNNSTNNSNVVVNNSTNQNITNYISATKAKEIAQNYTAVGVTLGTPTLTTLNGIKVWEIPVKTVGTDEYVDSIYINAITGKKVQ